MISFDQLKRGAANYLDNELMPKLPPAKQWLAGSAAVLALDSLPQLITTAAQNPMLAALGIVTPDGVDLDRVYTAVRSRAEKTGAVAIPVPFLGQLTISATDLDTLYDYIRRA